jgi:hypothetical protein
LLRVEVHCALLKTLGCPNYNAFHDDKKSNNLKRPQGNVNGIDLFLGWTGEGEATQFSLVQTLHSRRIEVWFDLLDLYWKEQKLIFPSRAGLGSMSSAVQQKPV